MALPDLFQKLDFFLTGKQKELHLYPQTGTEAYGTVCIHLSDGGYSRLYGYFDSFDIWCYVIGSESREEPKKRLATEEGKLLLSRVTTEINYQIKEQEKS